MGEMDIPRQSCKGCYASRPAEAGIGVMKGMSKYHEDPILGRGKILDTGGNKFAKPFQGRWVEPLQQEEGGRVYINRASLKSGGDGMIGGRAYENSTP